MHPFCNLQNRARTHAVIFELGREKKYPKNKIYIPTIVYLPYPTFILCNIQPDMNYKFDLQLCLMPLSAIFQLYHGNHF
jgi:hypothetical protein